MTIVYALIFIIAYLLMRISRPKPCDCRLCTKYREVGELERMAEMEDVRQC